MLPSARPVPIPVAANSHGPRQVFRLGPRLPAFPLPVAHEGSWSAGLTAAGPLPILTGFPFDAGRFRRPWTRYSRQGTAACQRVTKRGMTANRSRGGRPLVVLMPAASRQPLPAGPGRYPAVQRGRWRCLADFGRSPRRSGHSGQKKPPLPLRTRHHDSRNDRRPPTYKKDSPKAALAMSHHGIGRHGSSPAVLPYLMMKTG